MAWPTHAPAESITVAVGAHIKTLDPHQASTFAEGVVAEALHLGLVRYESSGNIVPGLAESWTISNDGRRYTFSLRPKLTWSNGASLTAEHVVAGFKRALEPSRPSPFAEKLSVISYANAFRYDSLKGEEALGIEVTDPQTLEITLDRRAANFLHTLAHAVAMPFPSDASDQERQDWIAGRLTSGSYRVVASAVNDRMDLHPIEAGPNLTIHIVRSTQDASVLAAKSDAIVTAALPMVTQPSLGDRGDWVRVDRSQVLYAYGVNMARQPFNTIEARHALAMAINRETLLEALPPSTGKRADQLVAPEVMGLLGSYTAPFAPLTLEEREAVAAALLAEQGFDQDNPLNVILRIPEGDIHRAVADQVALMWAEAGIGTEIVESPLPAHWQALDQGDYDVAYMAWPGGHDTPLGILEPLSRSGGPWNFPRYGFEDFTERLNRATARDDDDERLGYYREAEKALIEDQTLIALFFYRPLTIVSPAIQGWQSNGPGIHPLSSLSLAAPEPAVDLIRPALPLPEPSFGEAP